MKNCSQCKEDKELSEFHNKSSAKDGKCTQCKVCVRSNQHDIYHSRSPRKIIHDKRYWKHYRNLNKEKLQKYRKEYWLKIKDDSELISKYKQNEREAKNKKTLDDEYYY